MGEPMSMKLRILSKFGCMAIVLLFAVPAPSAIPANLTVAGHPGGSLKLGREDTSDIFAIEHILVQSFDQLTGFPDGLPTYGPLTVVKHIDKATPGLHKAWAIGEVIKEVTLDFYRIDPTSREESKYFVISLFDARIVSIELSMPMSFLPQNEAFGHMEKVGFVYREVNLELITVSDDVSGDVDGNQRVDLRDFAALQRCFSLPPTGALLCLNHFDFDLNQVITLDDHSQFIVRFTGP